MEVKIKGGTIVGVVEEPKETPKKEAPKKEKKAKDEK